MKPPLLASLFLVAFLPLSAWAKPDEPAPLRDLANQAVSSESSTAATAIAQLREAGPTGLDALFAAQADGVRALQEGQSNPELKRLRAAIEAVSGQRDCHASHLYWFTDFAQAQATAAASGKPILSLRLLGRLDEEFSCANSRFFRTTLYANEEIASYLRDHFILHWKSVRPVPKITIDFGDGRVVQRTITGNSIHYALNADGTVIDALPGLYSAHAFLEWLKTTADAAQKAAPLNGAARDKYLRAYHTERFHIIDREWRTDLRSISENMATLQQALPVVQTQAPQTAEPAPPTALAAARLAVSKGLGEVRMLRATAPQGEVLASQPRDSEGPLSDAQWKQIAAIHGSDARLDPASVALIRAKSPVTDHQNSATTEAKADAPLLRTLRNLERSISEDTVRNEYLLHVRLHKWLSARPARNVDALNTRVYAELFLTPDSDPWLGLLPQDTYTALENDGRR